jgi:hypothetical protein
MCGTAEQAAEKGLVLGETRQKHTSGAEALVDLIGFMPGINPRPTARTSFSASCEAVPFRTVHGGKLWGCFRKGNRFWLGGSRFGLVIE